MIIQSIDFTAIHGLEIIYNTIELKRSPNLIQSRESWEGSQAPWVPWKQQNWLKEEFLLHNGSVRPRFRGSAPDSGSTHSSVCFGPPQAPDEFDTSKAVFHNCLLSWVWICRLITASSGKLFQWQEKDGFEKGTVTAPEIRDDRDTNVNTCRWIEMTYSLPGNNKITFMSWVDVDRIEKNRNLCFFWKF